MFEVAGGARSQILSQSGFSNLLCHSCFSNYSDFQYRLREGETRDHLVAARSFLQHRLHTSIATRPRSLCSSSGAFFPVLHAGEMAATERRCSKLDV